VPIPGPGGEARGLLRRKFRVRTPIPRRSSCVGLRRLIETGWNKNIVVVCSMSVFLYIRNTCVRLTSVLRLVFSGWDPEHGLNFFSKRRSPLSITLRSDHFIQNWQRQEALSCPRNHGGFFKKNKISNADDVVDEDVRAANITDQDSNTELLLVLLVLLLASTHPYMNHIKMPSRWRRLLLPNEVKQGDPGWCQLLNCIAITQSALYSNHAGCTCSAIK
jgi:hypothetical protein